MKEKEEKMEEEENFKNWILRFQNKFACEMVNNIGITLKLQHTFGS
jgi:hypothetical protein